MLATDLAVLDHTDGSMLLVANAVNYDATDERVELAWADAVDAARRDDRATSPQPAESTVAVVDADSCRRGTRRGAAATSPEERVRGDGRAGQGGHPRRRGVPGRALAALLDALSRRRPRRLPRAARRPTPAPTCTSSASRRRTARHTTSSARSPEALVKVTGRRAITHPIAGSRPRGKTPEEDVRLAEDLLADPKERSEHVMLVDLGRNDLQRVCRPGTVDVVEFMNVRRYSHVMHIESTVVGRHPRRAARAYDVLVVDLPCGHPLAARPSPGRSALIEHYEPSRRGVYGGVVGYLDFHGDLDMAIAIRTAVIKDGVAHVQAGAGHRRRLACPAPSTRRCVQQGRRGAARGRHRRRAEDRHDEPAEPHVQGRRRPAGALGAGAPPRQRLRAHG